MEMFAARHYRTAQAVRIRLEGGHYAAIEPAADDSAEMPWIAPGLVDLQINGFGGTDFNRPVSSGGWASACEALYRNGCTAFLAAVITNTREGYRALLPSLENARRNQPFNCLGYHMEGPFLNPAPGYHGAHHLEWMTAPDGELLQEWQSASGHGVRMVTVAPEMGEEAGNWIRAASREGIRISIGHSAAMGETLRGAVEAGASAWTHLGNAAPNPCDKFQNVIFHALAEDRLKAFVIPDGLHVPAHVFKVLARALGPRLMLTTDAMAGAGAEAGTYTLGEHAMETGNGLPARLSGKTTLAGSTLAPFEGVFRAAEMSGLPWPELWDAFSVRPAAWLGLRHGLETGQTADFCLLSPEGKLLETRQAGEIRHRAG
jgi:N-acetylglucosamine-6-phosphate deacetylase